MDNIPEYLCDMDDVLNFLYDLDNVPKYLSDMLTSTLSLTICFTFNLKLIRLDILFTLLLNFQVLKNISNEKNHTVVLPIPNVLLKNQQSRKE